MQTSLRIEERGYKPLLTLFKNKKLLSGGMAAILGLASVFAIIPGVKASAMLGQGASSGDVVTKQLTTGVRGLVEQAISGTGSFFGRVYGFTKIHTRTKDSCMLRTMGFTLKLWDVLTRVDVDGKPEDIPITNLFEFVGLRNCEKLIVDRTKSLGLVFIEKKYTMQAHDTTGLKVTSETRGSDGSGKWVEYKLTFNSPRAEMEKLEWDSRGLGTSTSEILTKEGLRNLRGDN